MTHTPTAEQAAIIRDVILQYFFDNPDAVYASTEDHSIIIEIPIRNLVIAITERLNANADR